VIRLLSASPQLRLDQTMIEPDISRSRAGHREFVIVRSVDVTCPECHGTGQYIGLLAVEACQECNGRGNVPGC
jgi:RecJ-like exonuclease